MRRNFETALSQAGTGHTVAEARALAFISRFPGLRQAALAECMGVEPMTLVGYLDPLEAAGLIKRSCDPSDRRAKLVTLTPAATPVLERVDVAMIEVRKMALAGLSPDDIDRVYTLLDHMLGNLQPACNETSRETNTA